jgi:hypothetical protein|tara:strand:- start:138 stop:608 length:471 start_codon:yes stop_codon:yes gene_type:complete
MKTILITIAIVSSIYTYDAVTEVKIVESKPDVEVVEVVKDSVIKMSNLTEAIIQVESVGNDSAYNKSEDAVGCLQIRPIMVREVNRLLKKRKNPKRYTLLNRWDRQKSIEMFLVFTKNISKPEAKARCWNGGPKGMTKSATIKYWNKVKTILTKGE